MGWCTDMWMAQSTMLPKSHEGKDEIMFHFYDLHGNIPAANLLQLAPKILLKVKAEPSESCQEK